MRHLFRVLYLPANYSGCGPELGELPEIWCFPFNISATAEASDFKYGTQLGFASELQNLHRNSTAGLFNYQVLSLVYKMACLPHLLPPIFWDYFTFSTSVHTYNVRYIKLYLSQANTLFGQRSLKFKGGQL